MVADSEKKKVSSTKGMKDSIDTSEFLKHREKEVVPKQMAAIKEALHSKDWPKLVKIIMQESNSLHSVCLDTYPPIFYMNETTKNLISLIHDLNDAHSEPVAAYTVDAGANCFVITKKEYAKFILSTVISLSSLPASMVNSTGNEHLSSDNNFSLESDKLEPIMNEYKDQIKLNRIIATKVGDGVKFI